jgi:hypothetical protein
MNIKKQELNKLDNEIKNLKELKSNSDNEKEIKEQLLKVMTNPTMLKLVKLKNKK